jgi:hypothetical protein
MICMSYVSACDMRMWYVCVHPLHHDHCKFFFWKKDCKRKDIDLATHEGWNKCMWHVCMRTHCIMRIVKKNKKNEMQETYTSIRMRGGTTSRRRRSSLKTRRSLPIIRTRPQVHILYTETHGIYRDTCCMQGHILYIGTQVYTGTHTLYRYTGTHTLYRDTWYIQGHMLYAGTHTIYRYTGIYRDTCSL